VKTTEAVFMLTKTLSVWLIE